MLGVATNDADYSVAFRIENNVVKCMAYKSWTDMLHRCYSKRWLDRHPTYNGTLVCDEWLYFMRFRDWWLNNYVKGWHLDKDFISESRIYSPDTCIYIPQHINKFINERANTRRDGQGVGVYFRKDCGSFLASIRNPISGKIEYLGLHGTNDEAHSAWKRAKLEIAKLMKLEMDLVDERLFDGAIRRIMAM